MRVDDDYAMDLTNIFGTWIVCQEGEDVDVHVTEDKFVVEVLRHHIHTPHPVANSGRVTEIHR